MLVGDIWPLYIVGALLIWAVWALYRASRRWYADRMPSRIRRKAGDVPASSESALRGWVYLLEHRSLDLRKIGFSKNLNRQVEQHRGEGWEFVTAWEFADERSARVVEQRH